MSQGNANQLSPKGVTVRRSRSDEVTAEPADRPQPAAVGELAARRGHTDRTWLAG